jgi:hypothetical protein
MDHPHGRGISTGMGNVDGYFPAAFTLCRGRREVGSDGADI